MLFAQFEYFLSILALLLSNKTINAGSIAKCSNDDQNLDIILESTHGKLRGKCQFIQVNDNEPNHLKSGNVYSWKSIPYAETPTGERRFKETVPKKPWSEVLNAFEMPNSCMQNTFTESLNQNRNESVFPGFNMWLPSKENNLFSEDCLYLNLWIPALAYLKIDIQAPNSTKQATKLPILVFFHGGLVEGSSSAEIYDPSTFVAATNTIVITVNYRLGNSLTFV